MIGYILQDEFTAKQAEKKLKKYIKDDSILEIGITEKDQAFIRTDWYVYLLKFQSNTVKVPVLWSDSKRPYLIGGILMVLFMLFFVGGIITDFIIVGISSTWACKCI